MDAALATDTPLPPEKPLWQRIWNFPLVAMLVALAAAVAGIAAAGFASGALAPFIDR